MVLKITLVLALIVAAILVIAALQPTDFTVQRSIRISAAPAKIFPQINDFHQWPSWSPYEKMDPAMQRTYGGPASGPGATYSWSGNSKAGAGRISILGSQPQDRVQLKLEMIKPFASTNAVEFTLKPAGDGTVVTWRMDGKNPLITKVAGLFMNMDRLVGGQFEDGLNSLKTNAEKM